MRRYCVDRHCDSRGGLHGKDTSIKPSSNAFRFGAELVGREWSAALYAKPLIPAKIRKVWKRAPKLKNRVIVSDEWACSQHSRRRRERIVRAILCGSKKGHCRQDTGMAGASTSGRSPALFRVLMTCLENTPFSNELNLMERRFSAV